MLRAWNSQALCGCPALFQEIRPRRQASDPRTSLAIDPCSAPDTVQAMALIRLSGRNQLARAGVG